MELTDEQLDMINRLQPLFKEKMGELIGGQDEIYCGENIHRQPAIFDYSMTLCDKCLRIPKPIDWQNPERGLWGMLREERKLRLLNSWALYPVTHEDDIADLFTLYSKHSANRRGYSAMKFYVVTREENLYDQEGEYFVGVFTKEPSKDQLSLLGINHFGRENMENTWYNLHEIEEGVVLVDKGGA